MRASLIDGAGTLDMDCSRVAMLGGRAVLQGTLAASCEEKAVSEGSCFSCTCWLS